jgi:hypothetical protein
VSVQQTAKLGQPVQHIRIAFTVVPCFHVVCVNIAYCHVHASQLHVLHLSVSQKLLINVFWRLVLALSWSHHQAITQEDLCSNTVIFGALQVVRILTTKYGKCIYLNFLILHNTSY